MKKLITPLPAGGFPLTLEDITTLQNQLYTSIEQLYIGLGAGNTIVSGCQVVSQSGLTCQIANGYVFIDGELKFFPGYSGSFPFYIISAPATFETRTYSNGAVQNSYQTKQATTSATSPGFAGSILMSPGTTSRQLLTNLLSTEAAARVLRDNQLQQAINDEYSSRVDQYNDLFNTLTSVQSVLNTKVSRVRSLLPWSNMTLENGFYDVSSTNPGYYGPQIMRTEDGFVHLRGAIGIPTSGSGQAYTLPNGYRTQFESRHTKLSLGGNFYCVVAIVGSALYIFPYAYPGQTLPATKIVTLDGISYYNDVT